jgi:hypothetical protein
VGKPKAPAPPDYAAAAAAQGEANVNAAVATNFLNQADQVGPAGSLKYTYDYEGGYRDPKTGQVIPRATATTTLSPEQQRLFDQQNQLGGSLNDFAIRGLDKVDQSFREGIDQNQLPGLRSGGAAPSFQTGLGANPFQIRSDLSPTQFQDQYDFSNVGAMPSSNDFTADRDRITDAYMQRLQPYLDRQRDQTATQLANQGITKGSEAWSFDTDALNRSQNDQRIAALLAGDQERNALFNQAMGIRGQGVNEAVAQGNMRNNAGQLTFAQMQQIAGFNNNAQNQQFSQNMAQMGAENQAQEAQFRSGLASDQFGNQARQQAIQEAQFFQDRPLNILNALRTGNQAAMPTFGNVTAGSNIGAAPVYNATADQYNAALQNFNIRSNQFGGLLSGLGELGGAAITKFSDRRLKQNIKHLGQLANGLGVYAYTYIWSPESHVGVMADEVAKIKPEALGPTVGGFATVNYGAL